MLDKYEFTLKAKSRRVFTISKQTINFNNEKCFMIVIQEHTTRIQLQQQQQNMKGIIFSNSVITSKIMDPIQTIAVHADILQQETSIKPESR